jgi:hypothetical protein
VVGLGEGHLAPVGQLRTVATLKTPPGNGIMPGLIDTRDGRYLYNQCQYDPRIRGGISVSDSL